MKLVRRWLAAATQNDVTTGQATAYPELQPLTAGGDPNELTQTIEAVAREMPNWRKIRVDADAHTVHAEAVTPLFKWVDDVTIWLDADGRGKWQIMVRSRSRVGKGDLGANARRIRAFLNRLAVHL